ncbi:ferruginol synthase-like [Sesamum indicum]|uniref:Ferruginol synthase-like n=1 Tax=Sesamum indicum TaxID=4182 RepID=A0A6I9SK35_SESIN|nr:ferruginol synthase-like [Sesamum indicum]
MDLIASFLLLLLTLIWAYFHLLNSNSRNKRSGKLPPGPYPFPIIGSILQLGQNPHQKFTELSKTYGPLMYLKLGSVDTIVVSSPEITKEILQTHDQAFPLRMITAATRALDHHTESVALLPMGSQWRKLRKICKEQMFSTQPLYASQGLRQEKLQKLLQYVQECCVNGRAVDIGHAAFVTSLNFISNTLFSLDFADYNTGSTQELEEIIHRLMTVFACPNLGDYFGFLGLLDPQGIKREAEFCMGKLLANFDSIIDQRAEASRNSQARKTDLLEVLLEISQGNQAELTRNTMKHLLLDLFVAGADTTSVTVEWAMTELLRNPQVMSKLKMEVRTVVGANKQVEESDISKLPYLQAVIKESTRYHPPGPFLMRRKDGDDLEIKNYVIPKNSVILINIWAIGRDPRIWPNPDSFEPERFLNREVDFKSHDFELTPFGAGRRICPGQPLAYRMVHLTVASLIQNFDWEFEPGITPQDVDLNEKFGVSLKKAIPLKAVPTKP